MEDVDYKKILQGCISSMLRKSAGPKYLMNLVQELIEEHYISEFERVIASDDHYATLEWEMKKDTQDSRAVSLLDGEQPGNEGPFESLNRSLKDSQQGRNSYTSKLAEEFIMYLSMFEKIRANYSFYNRPATTQEAFHLLSDGFERFTRSEFGEIKDVGIELFHSKDFQNILGQLDTSGWSSEAEAPSNKPPRQTPGFVEFEPDEPF